jgi:large subunit ribosomal protein L18Ae
MYHLTQITEKKPQSVTTYGIWMRYDSRTGHHNLYKEFRDVSVCGAVSKMYQDMASRHRSRFTNIQIVRTAQVPTNLMLKGKKMFRLGQYMDKDCKFPLHHRVMRPMSKSFKKTFVPRRPRTNFNF